MLDEMTRRNASKYVIFYICIQNMANFEAFRRVISSSINLLFRKNVQTQTLDCNTNQPLKCAKLYNISTKLLV